MKRRKASAFSKSLWTVESLFGLQIRFPTTPYGHRMGGSRSTTTLFGEIYRPVKAVTPDGQPFWLPDLLALGEGDRYRFLPNGKGIVLLQGELRRQDFWLFDLQSGRQRQLTNLTPGFSMKSFDISPDGKQIMFDRVRENSDIVLIDLPQR